MVVRKISDYLQKVENIANIYGLIVALVFIAALCLQITSPLQYESDQLYPKDIVADSPLNPYDRGGIPFGDTAVKAQYPSNAPYLGYVTAYLTPLSAFMAATSLYLGTTIVSHPGGIIDEILYNTRGLDTVAETAILFVAFAIAAFLYRRKE